MKNINNNIVNLGCRLNIYEGEVIKSLAHHNKPIYITENGIADAQDTKREKFINDHINQVLRAKNEGIDIRGYFYWALTDNFEWDKGKWPRFGLIEVNYDTLERKIRNSAYFYSKKIKINKN